MAMYRAVLQREREARADFIEDVATAAASMFDGKVTNDRVRRLRQGK